VLTIPSLGDIEISFSLPGIQPRNQHLLRAGLFGHIPPWEIDALWWNEIYLNLF
jgi:hypothetical protein